MTKRPLIAGNWKMHGHMDMAYALVKDIISTPYIHADVLVCPPFTLLTKVAEWLDKTNMLLGAQDCSTEVEGAYTGDISAAMLKDAGCGYVILGHSERRQYHQETDEIVRKKAEMAICQGIMPIICVGERWEAREKGLANEVVGAQLKGSLPASGKVVVAYEPVWAIGTGKTPSLEDIQAMHSFIYEQAGTSLERLLYGGSVKASNAKEILAIDKVDGALVGGASLKASEFKAIIEAA